MNRLSWYIKEAGKANLAKAMITSWLLRMMMPTKRTRGTENPIKEQEKIISSVMVCLVC